MRLVIKNDCEVIAMKAKKKSIYWGEISFYKSIIAAIIFSAVVLVVDQKNIPSLFIDKYGIKETVIGVIFGTIILSLCIGRIHISDLLKMPCGSGRWSFYIWCNLLHLYWRLRCNAGINSML